MTTSSSHPSSESTSQRYPSGPTGRCPYNHARLLRSCRVILQTFYQRFTGALLSSWVMAAALPLRQVRLRPDLDGFSFSGQLSSLSPGPAPRSFGSSNIAFPAALCEQPHAMLVEFRHNLYSAIICGRSAAATTQLSVSYCKGRWYEPYGSIDGTPDLAVLKLGLTALFVLVILFCRPRAEPSPFLARYLARSQRHLRLVGPSCSHVSIPTISALPSCLASALISP